MLPARRPKKKKKENIAWWESLFHQERETAEERVDKATKAPRFHFYSFSFNAKEVECIGYYVIHTLLHKSYMALILMVTFASSNFGCCNL